VLVLAASPAAQQLPLAKPDAARFPVPAHDTVTFWGHACCYIDIGGFVIVTDPCSTTIRSCATARSRCATRELRQRPDHSDLARPRRSLVAGEHRDVSGLLHVLCPEPRRSTRPKSGSRSGRCKPVTASSSPPGASRAVAAHHPGTAWSLDAAADGRALGWVIESARTTIYYTGDTDLFPGIGVVGAKYAPDIAI
jgi:hypothetical protein